MDPLSALAIVAAVVQFADIGGRLLAKSWHKYRERQDQDDSKSKNHWVHEAELEDALNELSLITRTVRGSTDQVISNTTTKTAEAQLSQLCKECESIAKYFQDALQAAKKRPTQKRTQNDHCWQTTNLAGLWSQPEVRKMQQRLSSLQQNITTTVILCIWEDSQQTKKRDADFSGKLNEILSLLTRIEDSATQISMPGVNSCDLDWLLHLGHGDHADSEAECSQNVLDYAKSHMHRGSTAQDLSLRPANNPSECHQRSTSDLIRILSHLATSDTSIIRDGIKETLDLEQQRVAHNQNPPINYSRQRDSQRANSAPETHESHIMAPDEPYNLVDALTHGLRFESLDSRQEAIPKNFQSTYHWIFDRQPMCAPDGPLWHSFPDWLENTTDSVYWITGKPGSGKSTMMKYIAQSRTTKDSLRKWSGPLPVMVVSYYAWIAGQDLQKSWSGLKRTMLHQAMTEKPNLIPLVAPKHFALAKAGHFKQLRWDTQDIDKSFDLLLRKCWRIVKLMLFIDGLDEFDLAPAEVVGLVNEIASISTDSLKICVASRPWTEFTDAFRRVPMVQMHLFTRDDTRLFVTSQLNSNQGFKEALCLHPKQVEDLKEEIVAKSQGVFLWVAVVVGSLLISFSEGDSLLDLQATLKMLPSDMSKLYDTIWARTEPRNRRDASWMIQLVMAAASPVEGVTLWFAEVPRIALGHLPANIEEYACMAVKRRLASRTRGLLELTGRNEQSVDFSHRTARDWVYQSEVWERICSSYGEHLNPHLVLFEAKTLTLTIPKRVSEYPGAQEFRKAVMSTLWYASESSDIQTDSERLVHAMDLFDKSVQETYEAAQGTWLAPDRVDPGIQHWSTKQQISIPDLEHNTFLNIAAQFSILPYIQAKTGLGLNVYAFKTPEHGFSLLDHAVLGYRFFTRGTDELNQSVPKARRISTVKFLLEAGSKPGKDHGGYWRCYRRSDRSSDGHVSSSDHYDYDYYDEVNLMIKAAKKARVRATLGRVFAIFRTS